MILPLLAAVMLQIAPAPVPAAAADSRQQRFDACAALAQADPAAARAEAGRWSVTGGAWFARQCAGLAYAREGNWALAAAEFDAAAKAADLARDRRAATYWAQAGNAWLAAGQPGRARAALDTALVAGTLTGLDLGEAQLDHARAMVAAGDTTAARRDLDLALRTAADDPLAWLLSATLARRMQDLPRAEKDIAEALRRSPDDASVQLEAGNVAAASGDEAGARAAWTAAVKIAPDAETGRHAATALAQFAPAPSK